MRAARTIGTACRSVMPRGPHDELGCSSAGRASRHSLSHSTSGCSCSISSRVTRPVIIAFEIGNTCGLNIVK